MRTHFVSPVKSITPLPLGIRMSYSSPGSDLPVPCRKRWQPASLQAESQVAVGPERDPEVLADGTEVPEAVEGIHQ